MALAVPLLEVRVGVLHAHQLHRPRVRAEHAAHANGGVGLHEVATLAQVKLLRPSAHVAFDLNVLMARSTGTNRQRLKFLHCTLCNVIRTVAEHCPNAATCIQVHGTARRCFDLR